MRCTYTIGVWLLLAACGGEPPAVEVDVRPRVEVQPVAPVPARSTRTLPATQVAWRDAALTFLRGGRVSVRRVDPGDGVRKGQALLGLDDRSARAAVAVARAARADAVAAREEAGLREERILALGDGASASQRDQVRAGLARAEAAVARAEAELERARVELDHHTLVAPFAGEIVEVVPEVGESVGTSAPVVRLVDASAGRIEIGLLVDELAGARSEDARFRVETAGGDVRATLAHVAPAADVRTGLWTATLRVEGGPPPGTPVRVHVDLPRPPVEGAVSVPRSAVVDGRAFVVDADGAVRARAVEVVDGRGDRLVVTGLSAEDRVVAHRTDPLEDGVSVVVVEPPP